MDELEIPTNEMLENLSKMKDDCTKLWEEIRKRPDIQKLAVKNIQSQTNRDNLCLIICKMLLENYMNANKEAYQELIHCIYTNLDIARINIDSEHRLTFLTLSLFNPDLKLSSLEKQFVIWEAFNQIGITKYQKEEKAYLKTDKKIDCHVDHGLFPYDIRYYILKNNNWNTEEKQKLINEFWPNSEVYYNFINELEWNVITTFTSNYSSVGSSVDCYDLLYETTYEEYLEMLQNKELVDSLWQEIVFLKELNELRLPVLEDDLDLLIK